MLSDNSSKVKGAYRIPPLFVAAVLLLLAMGIGVDAWLIYRSRAAPMETLRVGLPRLEQNALIYVAADRGLFARNGLNVQIKEYGTGVATLAALNSGEVDLAGAAEFPFVQAALRQEPVAIIAAYDRFENDYLLARRDRGIQEIADLKGKRIGLARNTIVEFYLGRFLSLHGLSLQDVTLVDLQPGQFVSAFLDSNNIDAIAAWQPYISQAQNRLPGALIWRIQNRQLVYGVLVCNRSWLANQAARRPGSSSAAVRFLKALSDAETYLLNNPEKVQAILQKHMGYDPQYLQSIWPQHQFGLSLDNSLVMVMTDESRWLIQNRLVPETEAPDFSQLIEPDFLKTIRPNVVEIVP